MRGWCRFVCQGTSICASLVNETNIPEGVEGLWVSLRSHRLPRSLSRIVVGVFYYPPNSPISTTLVDHIGYVVDSTLTWQPDTEIVILGDFNRLDLSDLESNSFIQVVNEPTGTT